MIAPRLLNSMLHDGTIVIVHSNDVVLISQGGLLEFPLESPQLGRSLLKSGFVVLLATRKYHSP